MEDKEIMENVVRIILNDDTISLRETPQAESEKRKDLLGKYIKLDVWAVDTDDNVYDTEVQKRQIENVRVNQSICCTKRSRKLNRAKMWGKSICIDGKNVFMIGKKLKQKKL